jgi:hypothetical protein
MFEQALNTLKTAPMACIELKYDVRNVKHTWATSSTTDLDSMAACDIA